MSTDVAEPETKSKKTKKAPAPKTAKPKKAAPESIGKEESGKLASAAMLFKILGDPTRLKLLSYVDGQKTVDDLSKLIGGSQPAVSHHIALMRHSGVLIAHREGKTNLYDLTDSGKSALRALKLVID